MAYYTKGTPATANTLARAENIAAELTTIVAAFDKIPEQLSLEQGRAVYALDTGVADAYLVALPATLAAYTTGLTIIMKAVNANTGASTVNVDGLGVKSIKRFNGDALSAGDIPAGGIVGLHYDGTNFQVAMGTLTVTGTVAIASGGTGATTAAGARTNLDVQADLDVPSQAEAEAGTATTERVWTAQRVSQAIAALSINEVTVQVFTAGGTYTKPSDLLYAIVELVGGGGGGGTAGAGAGDGGGGAGGYSREVLAAASIGATETVTIGAAGTANGGNGGTTSFGALLSATGGSGTTTVTPGGGGVGSGGDINLAGGNGQSGSDSNDRGGAGGASYFGGGGRAGSDTLVGGAGGNNTGTGGGGGGNSAGGAGGSGIVIVTEFKS